ncbi:MAG: peptide-methionine (S)-S-oxide reductase MsrA [Opitutaceae bacterium]
MKALFISALLGALISPMTTEAKTETLVLGGGCFWCTEASYELLPGVKSVVSGYAGGTTENPTYKEVCSETTGHAEVIRIKFDPDKITLREVLDFFWEIHDPTTLNRQGADVGTSYRSIILYASEEQRATAEASLKSAQTVFRDPIVTEIVPLKKFWPAEDYHQDYFAKNPSQGYCQAVIAPKIRKLERKLDRKAK